MAAHDHTAVEERLEALEEKVDELLDLARSQGLRSDHDDYADEHIRSEWEPGGVYY